MASEVVRDICSLTWSPVSSADHQKLEIIGKGAYGAVYKGRHRHSGHVVALKIINLDTEDDDVADIQKEISLLRRLMHGASKEGLLPNVIKYYASLMEGPKVWIIMELAEGGSIRTLVRPRSSLLLPLDSNFKLMYSQGHSRSRSSRSASSFGKHWSLCLSCIRTV